MAAPMPKTGSIKMIDELSNGVTLSPGEGFNVYTDKGGYLRITVDGIGQYRLSFIAGRGDHLILRTIQQHGSRQHHPEAVQVVDDAECAVIYRKVVS